MKKMRTRSFIQQRAHSHDSFCLFFWFFVLLASWAVNSNLLPRSDNNNLDQFVVRSREPENKFFYLLYPSLSLSLSHHCLHAFHRETLYVNKKWARKPLTYFILFISSVCRKGMYLFECAHSPLFWRVFSINLQTSVTQINNHQNVTRHNQNGFCLLRIMHSIWPNTKFHVFIWLLHQSN